MTKRTGGWLTVGLLFLACAGASGVGGGSTGPDAGATGSDAGANGLDGGAIEPDAGANGLDGGTADPWCVRNALGGARPAFECTSALERAEVCPRGVTAGEGYECMSGCWSGFEDGPCGAPYTLPDGGSSKEDAGTGPEDAGACDAASAGEVRCVAGKARGFICTPVGWELFFHGGCS